MSQVEEETNPGRTSVRDAGGAIALFLVVALDMMGHFLSLGWMLNLVSLLAVVAFFLNYPAFNPLVRVSSVLLLALGVLILAGKGAPPGDWMEASRNLASLFDLIALVRFLAIPWELGGYREVFADFFARKQAQPAFLYAVAASFSYLMANVLLVGAVPVVARMLKETAGKSKALPEQYITRAVSAGFISALFFTPIAPLQAIGLKSAEIRWLDILPLGLLASLAGFFLNILLGVSELRRSGDSRPALEVSDPPGSRAGGRLLATITHYLIAMAGMAAATLLGERYLGLPSSYIITLVTVLASFLWSLLLGKPGGFIRRAGAYAFKGIGANATEFGLLFSAGFLALALNKLGLGEALRPLLITINSSPFGPLLYPFLTLVIWGIAFTGIHPLALIAIAAGTLSSSLSLLNTRALFLALVAGGAFAYLTSPFSISLIILSGLTGRSTVELGLGYNRRFAIIYALIIFLLMILASLAW